MSLIADAILKIYDAFRNLDEISMLCMEILGVVIVISICFGIYCTVRKLRNFTGMLLSVLCAGVSIFLFLIAPHAGMILIKPDGDPALVADSFFSAVCAGDAKRASSCLTDSSFVFSFADASANSIDASVNETEHLYMEKISNGYSYKLIGKPEINGLYAVQNVRFRYFAPEKTTDLLKEETMKDLDKIVQIHSRDEIYDENDQYLPGITDDAYRMALYNVVDGGKDDFYDTVIIKAELYYDEGIWKLKMSDELRQALNGGCDNLKSLLSNIKSDALSDVTYIPKLYVLDENVLEGNKPDQSCYFETDDPAKVQEVVDGAWALLGDQRMAWNTAIKPISGTKIKCYCDETILAITWRQRINGEYCTCSEVKIADPSQIRRKLCMDTFGSPVEKTATALANEANAVLACNGDYYKYRPNGICVYQRKVCRAELRTTDTCYVDGKGDLIFSRQRQFEKKEDVQKFVDDNDILFGVSFGPILIDNGEIQKAGNYLLGQVNEGYSRSSIGQIDELHYFCMTINHTRANPAGGRIKDSAQIMYDFGCKKAYALDGGQTAEIVMNGAAANPVDWSNERMVSDIIYFATAVQAD